MLYSVGLATDGVCVFVRLLCGRTFLFSKFNMKETNQ